MAIITIPQTWIDKCEQFSLDCAKTNLNRYKSRGQASIDKIVSDIFVGKMGECAVFLHKHSLNIPCTEPDFEIYLGKKKSYAADLTSGEYKIHCKTQSIKSAKLYGISWILQCKSGDADKLFKFRDPTDIAALCVMKSDSEVELLAEIPIETLFVNDLLEEPKLDWFKGTKKSIYWESIKKKGVLNV